MTHWSREYLYTGGEHNPTPACQNCKHCFRYCAGTDYYYCAIKSTDTPFNGYCKEFKWKL